MGQLRQEEQLRPRDLAFGRAETIFTRLDRRRRKRRAKPKSKKFEPKHLTEVEERRTRQVPRNENMNSLNQESSIFKLSRYTPKARRVSLAFYYFFIYSLLINHQQIIVKREFRKKIMGHFGSLARGLFWPTRSGKRPFFSFVQSFSLSFVTIKGHTPRPAEGTASTEMAEPALDDSLWNRVRNLTSLLLQKKK